MIVIFKIILSILYYINVSKKTAGHSIVVTLEICICLEYVS